VPGTSFEIRRNVLKGCSCVLAVGQRAHCVSFWTRYRGQFVGKLLHNDGTDESGLGDKAVQRPFAVFSGRTLDAENIRGLAGCERNIEAIQWIINALTKRLDEGFLARPATEKTQRPVASVEGAIRLVLAAGKKACCDIVGVADHTNGLDIDPDLASERKRLHRDILAV